MLVSNSSLFFNNFIKLPHLIISLIKNVDTNKNNYIILIPVWGILRGDDMDKKTVKHSLIKRDQEEIKSIQNRIKRAVGQLNGVSKMIDDNRYCGDIIIQLSAVSAAVNEISKKLFKEHISNCLVSQLKEGKDEEVSNEILNLLKVIK